MTKIENILAPSCGSIEVYKNNNDDLSVVNSARVSFAKRHDELDQEKDPRLINYLRTHNHFTPFTHARFTFEGIGLFDPWKASPESLMGCVFKREGDGYQKVRHSMWGWKNLIEEGAVNPSHIDSINHHIGTQMPHSWEHFEHGGIQGSINVRHAPLELEEDPDFIDVTLILDMPFYIARQWFKHQVGFSRNEVSRRYVDGKPEFFIPEAYRGRPEGSVKQGSGGDIIEELTWEYGNTTAVLPLDDAYEDFMHDAESLYRNMLSSGVCPEQARGVLPMATMTQFFETGSLSAYNRLLKQRLDPHAQLEIRKYANAIKELF